MRYVHSYDHTPDCLAFIYIHVCDRQWMDRFVALEEQIHFLICQLICFVV